jgi:hypothetical protein
MPVVGERREGRRSLVVSSKVEDSVRKWVVV